MSLGRHVVARARKTGALGAGSGRQANQSQAIAKSLDDFRRRRPPPPTTQRGPSPLQTSPHPPSRPPPPPSCDRSNILRPPPQSCCSCNAPPSPWLDGPPSRPSCAAPSRPPSSAVSLSPRRPDGKGGGRSGSANWPLRTVTRVAGRVSGRCAVPPPPLPLPHDAHRLLLVG